MDNKMLLDIDSIGDAIDRCNALFREFRAENENLEHLRGSLRTGVLTFGDPILDWLCTCRVVSHGPHIIPPLMDPRRMQALVECLRSRLRDAIGQYILFVPSNMQAQISLAKKEATGRNIGPRMSVVRASVAVIQQGNPSIENNSLILPASGALIGKLYDPNSPLYTEAPVYDRSIFGLYFSLFPSRPQTAEEDLQGFGLFIGDEEMFSAFQRFFWQPSDEAQWQKAVFRFVQHLPRPLKAHDFLVRIQDKKK